MKYAQLFSLIEESRLSPEEFGQKIGISGMTLRRWLSRPAGGTVDKAYVPAIREACYDLIASGKIRADTAAIQATLQGDTQGFGQGFMEAMRNWFGLSKDFLSTQTSGQKNFLADLSRLGTKPEHRAVVDRGKKAISAFKSLSQEWSNRIALLGKVVASKRMGSGEKLIAYGALFYLLTPFDLIPDHIPVIGLVDDFCVLGAAATYYLSKFSDQV